MKKIKRIIPGYGDVKKFVVYEDGTTKPVLMTKRDNARYASLLKQRVSFNLKD